MAVTLQARAGSSLKAHLRYWTPDRSALMPTDGHTARLQLRSAQGSGRVLVNARAWDGAGSAPSGTILALVEDGHWRLVLSGAVTSTLPPVTRFELELVNDADPDDSITLASGVINVTPQAVVNA